MGGEELKWRQLKHNQLMSLQVPHFSPRSTAKTNDKKYKSQKEWYLLVEDVVTASRYSEKIRLKKLLMMMK